MVCIQAATEPFLSLFLLSQYALCPSIFLPLIGPLVPAALPLPINHTTTRHVLNVSTGAVPASLLSLGRVVIWWFCLSHGGGDLERFETTEYTCNVAFEAIHQFKYITLKSVLFKSSFKNLGLFLLTVTSF